ncbi:f-box domain containing protein [Grosmannia clavigera kw1407]|uniref:F-box domain containing protein n=1 Tax=Grosmannia clavigera (strain kw1407 / UAMH 11150) TaxID=655863 RepID=F0X785_GROCL|nr:f-box domain containing protein [Grosmannia clavigera kw1407]EFX06692.1 f-box domain containing protein [Grosmannia clavigera kw1407]
MDPLDSVPADEGMPFGRLWALCPHGHREQPTRAAVLAKKHRRNSVSLCDIDLLALRGMYNTAFSPICRLPDEMLVRIMGHLDWLDMLCIRRTSRIFLRLFGRYEFSHLHDNNTGLFDLYAPWMVPALPVQDRAL